MESSKSYSRFISKAVVNTLLVATLICTSNQSVIEGVREVSHLKTSQHEAGDVEGSNNSSTYWRVEHTVAVVGRLFRYHLTSSSDENMDKNESRNQIKYDPGLLPDWLFFNKEANSIEGMATPEQIGHVISIHIRSNTLDEASNFRIKHLAVTVIKDNNDMAHRLTTTYTHNSNSIHCDTSVTKVSIIIDIVFTEMSSRERVEMIDTLSSYFNLPVLMLVMVPGSTTDLWNADALIAGPGDTPKLKNLPGTSVEWIVGCGNVHASQMKALELLETSAVNGSLSKVINQGILGWHITNRRQRGENRMKRRAYIQVQPTPTLSDPQPQASRMENQGHRHEEIPVSLWLRPQLEIFITTTRSLNIKPDKSSGGDNLSHSVPIIQPTPTAQHTLTSFRTRDYVTISHHPADSSDKSVTPGYLEPSLEYGRPSYVSPTASLPDWSIYPDGIHSSQSTSWSSKSLSAYEGVSATVTIDNDRSTTTAATGWFTPSNLDVVTSSKVALGPVSRSPDTDETGEWPIVLPQINTEAGKVFLFKIPTNTFQDKEDGYTDKLRLLKLMTIQDRITGKRSSWVKLNETSQTVYGLALSEHIGIHRFLVDAVDRDKNLIQTPLQIRVSKAANADRFTHEFSATLDLNYTRFLYDVDMRVAVVNKLANAFGDRDVSKITLTSVLRGSVEIRWTNNSLPLEPCPFEDIVSLKKHILRPDGSVNQRFLDAMIPYKILNAKGKPMGSCIHDTPTYTPIVTTFSLLDTTTPMSSYPEEPAVKQVPANNFLLYVVIAIIIFLVALLILIIICVVCYKKQSNRSAKKCEEKLHIGGSHKGIPIIFQDELDQSTFGKGTDEMTPISTLKSMKSAGETDTVDSVPPPGYTRSQPGSVSSTLRSDWKSPLLKDVELNNDQDNTIEKKNQQNNANKLVSNTEDRLKN